MAELATDPTAHQTVETPRRRRGLGTWFAEQDARELIGWGLLIVVTLVVRFIALGERAFHHDESQDAYFSYLFRQSGDYQYNPLLHGPLRFYLTALMYVLFGDSNFTARLAPALMGAAMIPLCWLLRPLLGRVAAFSAAALFAIGPSYLYFSRFAREDIYFAMVTLALLIAIWRFIEKPRVSGPAWIGALVALSYAIKETMFITVFVMGLFFIFVLIYDLLALRFKDSHESVLWVPIKTAGWEGWGWCLAAFALVYAILFTTFLTHPSGIDGLKDGLDYWLGQHEVRRGGEGPRFYSVILVTIEWPAVVLGIIGTVHLFRRKPLFTLFLVWDFFLSLAVYSWAGEKFAWLVLHPLLPLVLLAGAGIQAIWEGRKGLGAGEPLKGAKALAGFAVLALCAFYVGVSTWWVNVEREADPREFLVSTQSAPDVKAVADQVVALSEGRGPGKAPPTITIDAAEGATFPYAWYFRHLSPGYPDLSQAGAAPPSSDVLVLTEGSKTKFENMLTSYDCRQFQFRIWWVRDYGILKAVDKTSPGPMRPKALWDYITKRKTWTDTGGMKEWLCIRKGL
jgi:uncharacterized protein (TIGR03663 family)